MTTITINQKEYVYEDMSDTQKYYVAQINDLDRKIADLNMGLAQLNVAKQGFVEALIKDVESVTLQPVEQ